MLNFHVHPCPIHTTCSQPSQCQFQTLMERGGGGCGEEIKKGTEGVRKIMLETEIVFPHFALFFFLFLQHGRRGGGGGATIKATPPDLSVTCGFKLSFFAETLAVNNYYGLKSNRSYSR